MWEQEQWCSEGSGIRTLGEEHNQIFIPVQWDVFSLRIAFTHFNLGYIFLPLIYFFLVLIVWYNALLIYVVSIKIIFLLLFCYLIKDSTSSYLFLSFLFYFSNNLKVLAWSLAFNFTKISIMNMIDFPFSKSKKLMDEDTMYYALLKMFYYIISFA